MPLARPKPAVQSGGINAVAIATPGMTLPLLFVELATMPAKPPKKAISTSYTVGCVRASSSLCASSRGVSRK